MSSPPTLLVRPPTSTCYLSPLAAATKAEEDSSSATAVRVTKAEELFGRGGEGLDGTGGCARGYCLVKQELVQVRLVKPELVQCVLKVEVV